MGETCHHPRRNGDRPHSTPRVGSQAMGESIPDDRPIEIVPSVLPADLSRLGDECIALEKAGVDRIQFDVMDGRFVPNLTFGADVIASVRPHVTVPFEAHLMVHEPSWLIPDIVNAGCGMVIVHEEANTHLHRVLGLIATRARTPRSPSTRPPRPRTSSTSSTWCRWCS